MVRRSTVLATAFVGFAGLLAGVPAAADAAPVPVAKIAKTQKLGPLRTDIWVTSPAMKTKIKLSVLTPADSAGPRPTVYMLDGAGAEGDVSDWITKGHAGRFFAGKNVNVVLPTGGKGSFYTDWQKRDPKVGQPMCCLLYTSPSPRDRQKSRMPSSA